MTVAVIAGSGLGDLASLVRAQRVTPFSALDGVGACTVNGHAGEIRDGSIAGRRVLLVLGRRHLYEGDPASVDRLIDGLAGMGATSLLLTSAAGALRRWLEPGELVVVRDVVDLQNRARLARSGTGPPPRLDPVLTLRLERAAVAAGVAWQRGTLACGSGPAYETVAEVSALQIAGADVAAMSAAPELSRAGRIGLPAAAVAVVTNPCTGLGDTAPSHREVLAVGRRAVRSLGDLVTAFISIS